MGSSTNFFSVVKKFLWLPIFVSVKPNFFRYFWKRSNRSFIGGQSYQKPMKIYHLLLTFQFGRLRKLTQHDANERKICICFSFIGFLVQTRDRRPQPFINKFFSFSLKNTFSCSFCPKTMRAKLRAILKFLSF